MHRTPPNCLELREDEARNALDAFRTRVLAARWQIAELIELFVGEHPFHARRAVRAHASNQLSDLMDDLTADLETALTNRIIEIEDEMGDAA